MALFVKKIWKDRMSEYPTRRTLTKENGTTELVTVARSEGTISQEGDSFSSKNMNDLETRIQTAIGAGDIPAALGTDIISALNTLNTGLTQMFRHYDVIYDGSAAKIQPTANYVQLVAKSLTKYTFILLEVRTDNGIGNWSTKLLPLVAMPQGVPAMVYSAPTASVHFKTSFLCDGNGINVYVADNPVLIRIFGIY